VLFALTQTMALLKTTKTMLPGDCVLTTYGVAVVTKAHQDQDGLLFYARLWRMPGKSIASSSYACLTRDTVSSICFIVFLNSELFLQLFDFCPGYGLLPMLLRFMVTFTIHFSGQLLTYVSPFRLPNLKLPYFEPLDLISTHRF